MEVTAALPIIVVVPPPGVSRLEKPADTLSSSLGVSMEECGLAVEMIMGHGSMKSVDSTDKADHLVEAGVVINCALMPVFPLALPIKKVVVSNVPAFPQEQLIAADSQQ